MMGSTPIDRLSGVLGVFGVMDLGLSYFFKCISNKMFLHTRAVGQGVLVAALKLPWAKS